MWEQIRANERRSLWLMGALLALLAAMGYAVAEALAPGQGLIGVPIAGALFLVQMAVYWFAAESVLLAGLGARELQREDSPRLFNIVEEMRIASGFPHMPRIFLVEDSAPNAFAVGRNPGNSIIAVTTGLMYRLNRDELQGVIAHEIAHLQNRDTKFMTLAAVILGSIILLQELFFQSMRAGAGRTRCRSSSRGSGSGGGGAAQIVVFILVMLIVVLGPLCARLLYFACSRKREFLADACSAQYTRFPDGLASALEKIARADTALPVSKALAPMFIVNPLREGQTETQSVFSSHPSTSERVRVLRAMAGASLADYETAYRATQHAGIIGASSLRLPQPRQTPKRAASEEGPIEDRQETKATIHRLYGYVEAFCQCGMRLTVPEMFENDEVVCIRCGLKVPLPSAKERLEGRRGGEQNVPDGQNAPPLQYTRTGAGWETFRCACGGSVQLSPQFIAPRTHCPKCRRQIEIAQPEAAAV